MGATGIRCQEVTPLRFPFLFKSQWSELSWLNCVFHPFRASLQRVMSVLSSRKLNVLDI